MPNFIHTILIMCCFFCTLDYCVFIGELLYSQGMENISVQSQMKAEMSKILERSSLPISLDDLNSDCYLESHLSDNSESDKSDDESKNNEISTPLEGRRRTRQAVKFLNGYSQVPNQSSSSVILARKRSRGCQKCPGCLRKDCGTCIYCKDRRKFGGEGKKKQKCELRVCSNIAIKKVGLCH